MSAWTRWRREIRAALVGVAMDRLVAWASGGGILSGMIGTLLGVHEGASVAEAFAYFMITAASGAAFVALLMTSGAAYYYMQEKRRARLNPATIPTPAREAITAQPTDPVVLRITLPSGATFGVPTQRAAEMELAWWHIDVTLNQGQPEEASVALVREDAAGETAMMWATPQGPQTRLLLRVGEPELVPIAARALVNAYLSGAPGRLPAFPMPAGVCRLTDDAVLARRL